MKKIFLLVVHLAGLSIMTAAAVELNPSRLEIETRAAQMTAGLQIDEYLRYSKSDDEFGPAEEKDKTIYEYEYKSPKKAFIYSLIIPGWGQKYAGSTILKPILFFGVEAASWALYFKYHGEGNDKTDEFQRFADEHWIEGDRENPDAHTYRGWLLDVAGVAEDTGFTHQLPDSKDQQYYEMIGKYDQFRGGWDDYWENRALYDDTTNNPLIPSPNRDYYNRLRGDANDLLDKANAFIIVSLANHLLSAVDAAISANRHNKSQSGDSWMTVRAEMKKYSATREIPILIFSFKF
jgi:hypothetical protein